MTSINLFKRPEGIIPVRKGVEKTGKIFSAENTGPGPSVSSNALLSIIQCAAFDSTCSRLIICDNHGNAYAFYLNQNKYNFIISFGQACTALCSLPNKKDEFVAALVDNSLRHFNIASKQQLSVLRGHRGNVSSLSAHRSSRLIVSTGADTAMMWDLSRAHRLRQLTVKEEIGILRVLYVPGILTEDDLLVTCFRDDSIFLWDSEAMHCLCKLQMPSADSRFPYRAVAVSPNGRYLAMAGKSHFIHLWNLESRDLQQVLEMPTVVKSCRQLHFVRAAVPASKDGDDADLKELFLCVLSQDRLIRCIQLSSCQVAHEINGEKLADGVASASDAIKSFFVAANTDNLAIVTLSGKLVVYSLSNGIAAERIKTAPPPPIKLVRDSAEQERRQLVLKANLDRDEKENARRLASCLDKKKLRAILREYGQFPAKYRGFIWRSVLQLPENYEAFTALNDKGLHPSFELLHEKYPVRSQKLMRILQRCLSALAHWSPIFGEADFIPLFAFPFLKLFQNNQVFAFETVATILVNWCQCWFEYFPNPPINFLSMAENVLAHHDRELYEHYVSCGITTEIYAWPLLETAFSEVFTREEWLCLWDSIICYHPGFILFCVAAYSIGSRGPLMLVREVSDFEYFFHHRNPVTPKEVLRVAAQLRSNTPSEIHPGRLLPAFQPLTAKQYPVFNKFPKFIVDHQVKERERIRDEEREYLQQRHAALELQRRTEQHAAEEENWYRHQELLLEAEEKRRSLIAEEETRLREQRKRLSALNREVKMKELELLDAARRKYRDYHQRQREAEVKRLESDLKRKVKQRSEETERAIEEAEIRHMGLRLQKGMFENELQRDLPTTPARSDAYQSPPPRFRPLRERPQRSDVARLKGPLMDLSRAERQARDDQHLADVIGLYDRANSEASFEHELEEIHHKNRTTEEEIEDLLQQLKEARLNMGRAPHNGAFTEEPDESDSEPSARNGQAWLHSSDGSLSTGSLMAEVRSLRERLAKRL